MTRRQGRAGGIFLLTVALTCVSAAQEVDRPAEPAPPSQSQTVKVDVDLVQVYATVTDPRNRSVTGLNREHFRLWEDKIEQEVSYFSAEDVDMSVGIIFDASGSMEDKLSHARDAAVTFMKYGNPLDEYFLIPFADRPTMDAAAFTTDIAQLQNKLIFTEAKGSTALYDAVYVGLEKLRDASNTKKALLLITDGEDNKSRYSFSNVREFVKEQDVQIFAIGIVNDWNSQLSSGRTGRALIEELVEITGGRAFFPDSVYELEDICQKIGAELKHQYILGYSSTNEAKDGKWRKLRLEVKGPPGVPRLSVRAKAGYYAATGQGQATNKD